MDKETKNKSDEQESMPEFRGGFDYRDYMQGFVEENDFQRQFPRK